jgi:hypothetical protein
MKYVPKDSLDWSSAGNIMKPDMVIEFDVVKSHIPLKYRAPSELRGVTSQKSIPFIDTVDFMNVTGTVIPKSLVYNLHLFL